MTLPPFRGGDLAWRLERLAFGGDLPSDLEAVCAQEPAEVARSSPAERVRWVLEEVQRRHGYLPERYLRHVAICLGAPRGLVFQTALGDDRFRFSPPPGKRLSICVGPSCSSRGAAALLQYAEHAVAAAAARPLAKSESTSNESASAAEKSASTSADAGRAEVAGGPGGAVCGVVSVQTVRCFGMCRGAPVFCLNDQPFPRADEAALAAALEEAFRAPPPQAPPTAGEGGGASEGAT